MAALETVTGTVVRVNHTGFQIAERPDAWFNPSRFAEPRPELPTVGQHVTLGLDGQGYVRTLEDTGQGAPPPTPRSQPGVCLSLRVAALQGAAAFLAGREDVDGTDLLEVAARFEAWLSR